ncbi:hypothetical protein [Maribellus sediminis]|uniref:hypothetical protein n=1 Tax=Maribellus sediminis TaxID=2696285 RepID=UPI001430E8E0|nr:hypothetical protein [Maribellus sediminis]
MKKPFYILLLLMLGLVSAANENSRADIVWGNSFYYNMNVGDSISFEGTTVQLLDIDKHCNQLKIGNDTLWLKVSRRSLPVISGPVSVFVADNVNIKHLAKNKKVHGLLTGDALICLTGSSSSWLDLNTVFFPVAFNDGFVWYGEEETYMFSYYPTKDNNYDTYPGIAINMNDARGLQKHWIVAIEDCEVVWIEDSDVEEAKCLLLASMANPGIYYVYDGLFRKNIEVRKGQKLERGELIGTAWGDDKWGFLHLAVIYSDSAPSFENRYENCLNFFPQLYTMYYKYSYGVTKTFSKGKIEFGGAPRLNGNVQNVSAFEGYYGKGWEFDHWNVTEKVEWVTKGDAGNARLSKVLFKGTPARCTNPENYFDYVINVRNGVYRIRAKVGDVEKSSWQKLAFENQLTEAYSLLPGEQKWTSEKVVKVEDHKLNVRIYYDGNKVAGLSEIVFQQAY